ncbi:MAG: ABC transporter ATP-binding protein [Vampirovibrionales bacterium]
MNVDSQLLLANPSSGICVEGVHKTFQAKGRDAVYALRGVSLSAAPGQVLGILGSNGAGKTTLINILTTVSRPDSGDAWVEGYSVMTQAKQVRQRLGVVSQEDRFDTYLTLWENLSLHAELHGLPKRQFQPRIEQLLKQVDLYDRRHSYVELFSGGMRRKASLIRALIHEPTILFLDEPTTGLDPVARRQVWEAVISLKQGRTLVLTTHYMEEADQLCDTLVLMNQGQVLTQGTPTQLKQKISITKGGAPLWRVRLGMPVNLQWMEALTQKAPQAQLEWLKPDELTIQGCSEQVLWEWVAQLPLGSVMGVEKPLPTLDAVFFNWIERPPAIESLMNPLSQGVIE